VDRRERERIMGEHQPRGQSERERREARLLAADLRESPVAGKPLPRRLRNFSPSVEGYARSVAGPPTRSGSGRSRRRSTTTSIGSGPHETISAAR
jgi:hypothetical protein